MEARVRLDSDPASAVFWPEAPGPGGAFGRRRDPRLGALLTVLTLGVYHFYFHAAAHAELMQQLGRRNRDAPLVFAYGGLLGFGVLLGPAALYLPVVLAVAVFIYLVLRQYALLEEAEGLVGLRPGAGAGRFFLWLVPGALILVGPWFAYRGLTGQYNRLWAQIERGSSSPGRVEAGGRVRPAPRREPVPSRSSKAKSVPVGRTNGSVAASAPVAPATRSLGGSGSSRAFSVRHRGREEPG